MKLTLNLASRRYMNRRALNYGFYAALSLLLLFCLWSGYGLMAEKRLLQKNQQQIVKLSRQLEELRGGPVKPLNAAERKELETKFAAAGKILAQDAFRWSRLLDRMETLLPAGVSLDSFQPNFDKDSLEISGRARTLKEMRQFLDRLMKKSDFGKVFLKSHSRIKVKDFAATERAAIRFSISMQGVF